MKLTSEDTRMLEELCRAPQITGSKKANDDGAALFAVRVHLPC